MAASYLRVRFARFGGILEGPRGKPESLRRIVREINALGLAQAGACYHSCSLYGLTSVITHRAADAALARPAQFGDFNNVAQVVFEKVNRNLENFKGESKLSTWIYRIATNTALDKLKSPSSMP